MYKLILTKFDRQYIDCVIERNSKKEIIELADTILITFDKKGLMEHLNEMQGECSDEMFKSKYKIPDYFVNLILREHNMRIEEK